MGSTRLQNIFAIRDLLDRPQPNSPSFDTILRQEISCERDFVNATNNTGKPWAINEYQLVYTPGVDTYDINVSDFGKILFVTRNTGNPYIPRLPVPFDDITNLQYGSILQYFYGNGWAQSLTLPETPEKIAFFREGVTNSAFKCRIQPMPQQSWIYYLTYLPGYLGDTDPLETQVQLSEHAELLRLRAATALLPYARWSEDDAMNMERRKELSQAFDFQLQRREKLFADYIRQFNRPRTVTVEDWGYAS